MGRSSAFTQNDIQNIVKQAEASGWEARLTNNNSYVLTPPDPGMSPVVIGRNNARMIRRELRKRGLDPMGARPPRQARRPQQKFFDPPSQAKPDVEREQRPLPLSYSDQVKLYTFSDHAMARLMERNIGVFEVYAALDQPEYVTPGMRHDSARHFFRGDLEVIANPTLRRIITIMVADENRPREPLVPDAAEYGPPTPIMATTVEPAPPPVETPAPPPKEEQPVAARSKSSEPIPRWPAQAVDLILERFPVGHEFRRADLVAAADARWPGHTYTGDALFSAARRLVDVGTVSVALTSGGAHGGRVATFTLVKPATLRPTASEVIAHARAVSLRNRKAGMPSAPIRVRALVAQTEQGTVLHTGTIAKDLGISESSVSPVLAALLREGAIERTAVMGRYRVLSGVTPSTVEPESAPAQVRRPVGRPRKVVPEPVKAKPAKAAVPAQRRYDVDDDEDDAEVSVGPVWQAPPKAGGPVELAAVVSSVLAQLKDEPRSWVRIAVINGSPNNVAELASKRTAALDDYLGNPGLKFVVRTIGVGEAGIFVSWIG